MNLDAAMFHRSAVLLACCALLPLSAASAADGVVAASALQRCAAIGAPGERLACYDQLAGRPTQSVTLAVAAAPAAPAIPPEKAFGLSAVQRGPTAVDEIESISAKVMLFGQSKDARPTIALDNGQVWELDGADPLLAVGDEISIRRGALGSFVLRTAQKRTHRAHRLR